MTHYPEEVINSASAAPTSVWDMCADSYYLLPLLLLMLLVALYVFIERSFLIWKSAKVDLLFRQRIKDFVHDAEIESAENLCRKTASPAARVTLKGLELLGHPLADIGNTMHVHALIEKNKLSKTVWLLGFIAVASPLVGFLSAVLIMAHTMETAQPQSSDLFSALVTLSAGVIVGIVVLYFRYYVKSLLNRLSLTLNTTIAWFLDLLNEPAV